MARGSKGSKKQPKTLDESVTDYRYTDTTRKNVPAASIPAEGVVPAVPKQRFYYGPRP